MIYCLNLNFLIWFIYALDMNSTIKPEYQEPVIVNAARIVNTREIMITPQKERLITPQKDKLVTPEKHDTFQDDEKVARKLFDVRTQSPKIKKNEDEMQEVELLVRLSLDQIVKVST